MTKSLPEDIIARLEAATHSTFALDREIWEMLIPPQYLSHGDIPPPYTALIDAAMSLVPEGVAACVQRNEDPPHSAIVGRFGKLPDHKGPYYGKGATPAIALTVAALKARAAS